MSVEPTYSYYEKMTEELEKIVNEVKEEAKPLTDGRHVFLLYVYESAMMKDLHH